MLDQGSQATAVPDDASNAPPADVDTSSWQGQETAAVNAGYSQDEISDYKSQKVAEASSAGYSDDEIKQYFGIKDPDLSAMKAHVGTNLSAWNAQQAAKDPQRANGAPREQNTAVDFWDALKAGWQTSDIGLGVHGRPTTILSEDAPRAMRIASMLGQEVGDFPAQVVGGLAGAAAGTLEAPVVGTVGFGAAGAFAFPAALRKIMMDHYERGDIQDSGEFVHRLLGTTWETIKGATTGLATSVTGGLVGPVAGKAAQFASELTAMTAVSKGLEGKLPNANDFIDGAIVMGGLHGAGMVSGKLRAIYAQTGEHPADVIDAAQNDAELKQQLIGHDLEQPPQAAPTELKKVEPEPPPEGEKETTPEPAQHKLEPADLSVQGPPEVEDKAERTPEEQEILGKIGAKPVEESSSIKEKFDSWYAKNVDWTDPQKVAYAAWKSKTGGELSAEENPWIQSRLFAGHNDMVRDILQNGVRDENGVSPGRGLNQIYADVPGNDQGGFDAYSMAKRAIELDNRGIKPWADFSRDGAEKVVKDGSGKFQALHKERVDFMNSVLQYGVDKGVIEPDAAAKSVKDNKEYIPLNRIIPPDELTGGEIGGNGKLINKIKGSELDIQNPRASFYDNVNAIVRRAEVNDIRLKFLDNLSYEDENGESKNDFVREVEPQTIVTKLTDQELNDLGATTQDATILRRKSVVGPNQIAIFRDGKMTALEGTPLVIDSLKRLEGDQQMSDFTTKVAGVFAKSERIGTTSDPVFGLRHFFRSTVMSGVYSQTGMIPFIHPLLNLGEFMGKSSDAYKDFFYDGGATGVLRQMDENYVANGLEEADGKYPFADKAWNVIRHPLEASEAFIKFTDNLVRFTEYDRSIDKGASRDQAAFNAREVAPDFQKAGLQRGVMRQSIAFLGAHINSLDRMAQAFKDDAPGVMLRVAGAITAPSVALWLVNRGDKDIQDLPDYQRDLYWCFKVPDMFPGDHSDKVPAQAQKSGTIFKIPKPWGPGVFFGSGVERILDAVDGKQDPFHGFAKDLLNTFVPPFIPNMIGPVLDQFANKNIFNGRQLVNSSQQKELPEMMYQPYTTESAKQLGKLVGYVPGVRDIGPSADPLASPAVIENYVQGWGGTMGSLALKIGDAGLRFSGVTPKNTGLGSTDTPLADLPIMNEFLTRFPSMKSQPIQTFYDNLNQTDQVKNSITRAAKRGDIATATRLQAQYPDLMLSMDSTGRAISQGRKFIDLVQQDPNKTPTEKRQLIDTTLFQIGSAANAANQALEKFKKKAAGPDNQTPGGQ